MISGMFVPDPDYFPYRILDIDPGIKKAPDPGSAKLLKNVLSKM
jgi:hypothetical protein